MVPLEASQTDEVTDSLILRRLSWYACLRNGSSMQVGQLGALHLVKHSVSMRYEELKSYQRDSATTTNTKDTDDDQSRWMRSGNVSEIPNPFSMTRDTQLGLRQPRNVLYLRRKLEKNGVAERCGSSTVDDLAFRFLQQKSTMRIYLRSESFASFKTIEVDLTMLTADVVGRACKKFKLDSKEWDEYNLWVRRYGVERLLEEEENPLALQIEWLADMGYTEEDNVSIQKGNEYNKFFQFVLAKRAQASDTVTPALAMVENGKIPAHVMVENPNIYANGSNSSRGSQLKLLDLSGLFLGQALKDKAFKAQFLQEVAEVGVLLARANLLYSVPSQWLSILENLVHLDLSENRLKELPASFTSLQSLTTLDLSQNKFVQIPQQVLGLKQLRHVNLSANFIENAEPGLGKKLPNLEYLDLSRNVIEHLPHDILEQPSLKILTIAKNRVDRLPQVNHTHGLEMVSFQENAIGSYELGPSTAYEITIGRNNITSLSIDEYQNWANLTVLDISRNNLLTLPAEIGNLYALQMLNVEHNQLNSLPKDICQLDSLQWFSAARNNLFSLPIDIARMSALRVLNVQMNFLTCLPDDIFRMASLRVLQAGSNYIQSVPQLAKHGDRSGLPSVPEHSITETDQSTERKKFRRSSSPSKFLYRRMKRRVKPVRCRSQEQSKNTPSESPDSQDYSEGDFGNCFLEELYLGDNRLSPEALYTIGRIRSLRCLNISNNAVNDIGPLMHLTNLQRFWCAGCNLADISSDILHLQRLEAFFVGDNHLMSLPREMEGLNRLQILDVANNVFSTRHQRQIQIALPKGSPKIAPEYLDSALGAYCWQESPTLRIIDLSGNVHLGKPIIYPDTMQVIPPCGTVTSVPCGGEEELPALTVIQEEVQEEFTEEMPAYSGRSGTTLLSAVPELICARPVVLEALPTAPCDAAYVLFEGINGDACAAKAAGIFHKVFMNEVDRNQDDPAHTLVSTFLAINRQIAGLDQASYRCGAMAAGVYIHRNKLHVCNLGTAKVVLCRAGQPVVLTQDHTTTTPKERKRLGCFGAEPPESPGDDRGPLSRALGLFSKPYISAKGTSSTVTLNNSDEVIIIANSAVWEVVTPKMVCCMVRSAPNPHAASRKIRDYVMLYKGKGNIAVTVIYPPKVTARTKKGQISMSSVQEMRKVWSLLEIKEGPEALEKAILTGANVEPPTGDVTLVFTDIKNSTLLWETQETAMRSAVRMHHELMRKILLYRHGYEVKTEGDAFMVAFSSPVNALLWCMDCQRHLMEMAWPQALLNLEECNKSDDKGNKVINGLLVRMGIHSGRPDCERDPTTGRMDYYGPMVNRSARISGVADGGQVVLSRRTLQEIQDVLPAEKLENITISLLGAYKMKGIDEPEIIFQVLPESLKGRISFLTNAAPYVSAEEIQKQLDTAEM
eukprot:Clim_evm34s155 gene=Clim_evmTU34s155